MVALRLIQGFSLGGELPGAITFVVENAPRNAGLAAGFIFFCVNSGVALASALSLVVHLLLTEAQIARARAGASASRLAAMLGLVELLRYACLCTETPEFKLLRNTAPKVPFLELFRSHPP